LLQSLRAQLDSEKKRIASPEGQRLNTLAGEFRNLTIDFGFAEDSYKLTMNALETARLQASNQLKLLAVISKPGLPDEAIYPTRVYNLITLLIGLCLAFGIVRFSVSTIADHQD
jgi:capsular polysaccharide transport system permease protein